MRKILSVFVFMFSLALVGCATDGGLYRQQNQNVAYGVITSVERVPMTVSNASGLGLAGGAVVGGLLGNQVGKGNGRKLATVIGVVGGGLAGNEIERRNNVQTVQGARLQIRLDNGQGIELTQQDQGFRSGTRVRLTQQSNGQWVAGY